MPKIIKSEYEACALDIFINNKTLAQTLNSLQSAKLKQYTETGIDFPTYGADYGAAERRTVSRYFHSLKTFKEKMIFRSIVVNAGPSKTQVNRWFQKYKS